jgi:hypothetical protein
MKHIVLKVPRDCNQLKHRELTPARLTVHPEAARHLFEGRATNRNFDWVHAVALSREHVAGRWQESGGDPIRFDSSGRLLRGQHRVFMVVLVDRPVTFTAQLGSTMEVSSAGERTQKKWTLADEMSAMQDKKVFADVIRGLHYRAKEAASIVVALAKMLMGNRWTDSERSIPMTVVEKLMREYGADVAAVLDSCSNVAVLRRASVRAALALVHKHAAANGLLGEYEAAVEALKTGRGCEGTVHTLRTYLDGSVTLKLDGVRHQPFKVLRAFYAIFEGEELTMLRASRNEQSGLSKHNEDLLRYFCGERRDKVKAAFRADEEAAVSEIRAKAAAFRREQKAAAAGE